MNTENHYQETDLGNIAPNPRGEYRQEESYEYLDLVVFEGGSYVCLAENGTAITGISPESGKTTKYWQVITIPGSLTPEYIAMHDRVKNLSEQVEADAEEVRTAEHNVSGMEMNVAQMQEQTRQSAEAAERSKDSAAGYAASADASRRAAEESEQNVNAQVSGFDNRVAEKAGEAENDIEAARIAANEAIIAQQEQSVNEVSRVGIEAVSTAQAAAQTATEKAQAAATSEKNAAASEKAAKLSEENATKMTEQVAADKEQVANDRTAVENAKQEMTESSAQIEKNTQGISELKGDLYEISEDVYDVISVKKNLVNPLDIQTGFVWVNFGDGKYASESSKAIAIKAKKGVHYSSNHFDVNFSWFATNLTDISVRTILSDGYIEDYVPSVDGYFLITFNGSPDDFMLVNDSKLPKTHYDYNEPYEVMVSADNSPVTDKIYNLVDIENSIPNKVYVGFGDGLMDADGCYAVAPIFVEKGKKYYSTQFYNPFAYFAESLQAPASERVELSTLDGVIATTDLIELSGFIPNTDGYIFVSTRNNAQFIDKSIVVFGDGLPNEYTPYGKVIGVLLDGIILKSDSLQDVRRTIVVNKDGKGDYTTLKEAVEYSYDHNNTTIIVHKGVYDLIEEFGETYFANLQQSQNAGLKLANNVRIMFDSDSKVICHYKGNNEHVLRDFSPFNSCTQFASQNPMLHKGFYIENMTLECSRVRYGIHDECIGQNDSYRNEYVNCRMIKDNTENSIFPVESVIGGGLGSNGEIIINGCYFDGIRYGSDQSHKVIVSYHGTSNDYNKSNIFVSGCYFAGDSTFRLGYMGTSEKITYAYVSNNSFGYEPFASSETGEEIVNMEVIAWNNEIRN